MIVGLGVDVVDVERFKRAIETTPRLLPRLFTEAERQSDVGARSAKSLAARFAAKEAAMKALGAHEVHGWLEIEVGLKVGGAPEILLRGRAARVAAERGVRRLLVSMSHDGQVAMATVIAESELQEPTA